MNYLKLRALHTLAIVVVVALTMIFGRDNDRAILVMCVVVGGLTIAVVLAGILEPAPTAPMATYRNPEPILSPVLVHDHTLIHVGGVVGGLGGRVQISRGADAGLGADGGHGPDVGVVGGFGAGPDVGVVGARFWDGASTDNLPKLSWN